MHNSLRSLFFSLSFESKASRRAFKAASISILARRVSSCCSGSMDPSPTLKDPDIARLLVDPVLLRLDIELVRLESDAELLVNSPAICFKVRCGTCLILACFLSR